MLFLQKHTWNCPCWHLRRIAGFLQKSVHVYICVQIYTSWKGNEKQLELYLIETIISKKVFKWAVKSWLKRQPLKDYIYIYKRRSLPSLLPCFFFSACGNKPRYCMCSHALQWEVSAPMAPEPTSFFLVSWHLVEEKSVARMLSGETA